jgi:biopolymer transport exbB protein
MYNVIFNSGFIGFLIWVLLFAVSTAALAIAIRCVWSLRKKAFVTVTFKEKLISLLKQGMWQEAFDYSKKYSALAATIVQEELLIAHEKGQKERLELGETILDRRVKYILRLLNSLSMCANIAPMLGLLGTVTGMVDAFMGLGTAMGPEKASILAIAISQALYTTAAGLLVAIPAIASVVFFRNMLEKRIELVSDLLENVLKHLPEPERKAFSNADTIKL